MRVGKPAVSCSLTLIAAALSVIVGLDPTIYAGMAGFCAAATLDFRLRESRRTARLG